MKSFENLFQELQDKIEKRPDGSYTIHELNQGKHYIGKKILEEAGEVWMASEYESRERVAVEISQLLYHIQVMMLANGLEIEDVYKHL